MKVELHTQKGKVAEVSLNDDGVAVGSNATAQEILDHLAVVEPGNPPTPLRPRDGERYLRAMPLCVSGAYFWATLTDD